MCLSLGLVILKHVTESVRQKDLVIVKSSSREKRNYVVFEKKSLNESLTI